MILIPVLRGQFIPVRGGHGHGFFTIEPLLNVLKLTFEWISFDGK
jgi:hypothetical protein